MKKLTKTLLISFSVLCGLFAFGVKSKAATVTPAQVVTGFESVSAMTAYTASVPASYKNSTVYPVNVSVPGELYFKINSAKISYDVRFSLYTDAACTLPAASSSYFTISPNEVKTASISCATAGTYYLKVNYSTYTNGVAGTINYTPFIFSRGDRTVAENNWTSIAPSSNNAVVYTKIVMAKAGYLGLTQSNTNSTSLSASICRSDKSAIVSGTIYTNQYNYYYLSAGTYYISTKGLYSIPVSLKYSVVSQFTMSANKQLKINPFVSGATFDVKVVANKTGLMRFSQLGNTSYDITFLDSKKKILVNSQWDLANTKSFAVAKGKTYYVRLTMSIGSASRTMQYSITNVKTGKNLSKKKATTLKKKAVSQLIQFGTKKAVWYKFNLKKKSTINISITGEGVGNYVCYVYNKRGKKMSGFSLYSNKLSSYSKFAKGTYYLKITPKKNLGGKLSVKLL